MEWCSEAEELHKKMLPHNKKLDEKFSGSVVTGKKIFQPVEMNEDDKDYALTDDDGEVAVINSDSVAVAKKPLLGHYHAQLRMPRITRIVVMHVVPVVRGSKK